MTTFRTLVFWCHLIVAVAVAAIVTMLSITGIALTWQRSMQYRADTAAYRVDPPPAAPRLTAGDLMARMRDVDPQSAVRSVTWRSDAREPVAVTAGSRTVYLDPYTGRMLGEPRGVRLRGFFSAMTNWHVRLALDGKGRAFGRTLIAACNLGCLFVVLTGLYLWWPRRWNWTQLRPIVWFRRLSGKARDFNWHNTIGIWVAIPLVVIVGSAVIMAIPEIWAPMFGHIALTSPLEARGARQTSMPRDEGVAVSVPAARSPSLDVVMARATALAPDWKILTVAVPDHAGGSVTATVDRGNGGQPQLWATLTLTPDGSVAKWEPFGRLSMVSRVRGWARFLHTGEALGATGQTIAALASLGSLFLVYTGLALATRRVIAWRRRSAP
jgi:uncharacterized iron-regulated membrane protein